jgi:hypothetical protein
MGLVMLDKRGVELTTLRLLSLQADPGDAPSGFVDSRRTRQYLFRRNGENPESPNQSTCMFDSCFIGMNQVSMYHFVENVLSGFLVVFSSARLEPADD